MARKRNSFPSYLPHKQSGKARAVWTDSSGQRHFRMLPGPYDSQESRAAFGALVLELESSPHRDLADGSVVSVNELLLAFLEHAKQHYRYPDETNTNELGEYMITARYVREVYGGTPARDFGPLALKAIRQKFVASGWSRKFINQRVGRIRRMFKWAAGEELIPFETYHRLTAVTGLQLGRTTARETEPVAPVADAVIDATLPQIDATLPQMNRYIRGLVELQRHTGCRPSEAVLIRRKDIDAGGSVWTYRPERHKGSWRGKSRVIAIGPRAQEVLREFFTPNLDDYLFNPIRAVEELNDERSANRVTPRYPSHMKRNAAKRKADPRHPPTERYDRLSYALAIARACDRAFPPPAPLAQREGETHAQWWERLTEKEKIEVKAWKKSHRFHPHQLRHSFATRVRKEHGLEAAQVLLGHARADVTQVYAERNEELAASVAAKIS